MALVTSLATILKWDKQVQSHGFDLFYLRMYPPASFVGRKDNMLYTFVLDLKLTKQDEVKILEIQQPFTSGSVGFEQAYDQCIMYDFIMPFYQEKFNVPIENMDPRSRSRSVGLGNSLIDLGYWNGSKNYIRNYRICLKSKTLIRKARLLILQFFHLFITMDIIARMFKQNRFPISQL